MSTAKYEYGPRYSMTAMILHWVIAAAILFQIGVGWGLEHLGMQGFSLFQLHKSIGLTILLLSVARLGVRFVHARPAPVERGAGGALAALVHAGLYAVMLLAPLTGWLLVSTAKAKVPTFWFGLLPIPHLPVPMAWNMAAVSAHALLAWIALGLLALHVAGALRHHMLLRDGLLWRMVPGRSVLGILLLILMPSAAFLLGRGLVGAAAPAQPANGKAPNPAAAARETSAALTAPMVLSTPVSPAPSPTVYAEPQAAAAAAPPRWTIVPGGKLGFSVKSGDGSIDGSFAAWTGTISMDPDHPDTADIRIAVNLASASIGDSYKDEMIGNSDFFDTAAHPTATFHTTKVTSTGAGRYHAAGTLTLKGITAPQGIDFALKEANNRVDVAGSGRVTRTRFSVGVGDSASGLAPAVSLTFNFAAKRAAKR